MRCGRFALGVLVVFAASAAAAQPTPAFSDVTQQAGVDYLQHAANEYPNCILSGGLECEPERMSGGAAVADVDGDGLLDLFVTRLDASDLLFRNVGGGSFEDFTQDAGLAGYDLQSNGGVFGDIDNDGDPDLLVTLLGENSDPVNHRNYLFVNDGEGHFSEAAELRGVDVTASGLRLNWSATFGDYDRDGYLDIYVTEWSGDSHARLLRNRGASAPGFFEDATTAAGISPGGVYGFAPAFVDLDQDGWQDLVIAGDFGTSRLFWNDGDGTFSDGTAAAGVGTDENGMGSTFGDIDLDGDLDWFVTSIYDDQGGFGAWGVTGNRLYRNEGGRVFSDATDAAGVREGSWGWGTVFFDADNDGDLDLVMTNGVDFSGVTLDAQFNDDPMRLWQNDGTGAMSEVSGPAGLDDTGTGSGLLTFDYDDDGDLDLLVVNTAGTPRLYRNDLAPGNDWLRIRVVGRRTNRDAVGARVYVRGRAEQPVQLREVGVASHFVGQSEPVLHFGLGPGVDEAASVEVVFPASGRTVLLSDVPTGQTLVVTEPRARCGLSGVEVLLPFAIARFGRRRRA